jgi:hypothetical protein
VRAALPEKAVTQTSTWHILPVSGAGPQEIDNPASLSFYKGFQQSKSHLYICVVYFSDNHSGFASIRPHIGATGKSAHPDQFVPTEDNWPPPTLLLWDVPIVKQFLEFFGGLGVRRPEAIRRPKVADEQLFRQQTWIEQLVGIRTHGELTRLQTHSFDATAALWNCHLPRDR